MWFWNCLQNLWDGWKCTHIWLYVTNWFKSFNYGDLSFEMMPRRERWSVNWFYTLKCKGPTTSPFSKKLSSSKYNICRALHKLWIMCSISCDKKAKILLIYTIKFLAKLHMIWNHFKMFETQTTSWKDIKQSLEITFIKDKYKKHSFFFYATCVFIELSQP